MLHKTSKIELDTH